MFARWQQSITLKVLGIGFLALLMLIPLGQVQGLIGERNGLRLRALADIAQRWGAAQDVGGPMLAIPRHTRIRVNDAWAIQQSTEILLADQLSIAATMRPQTRSYGIYSTPVYEADLKITGRFKAADVRALGTQIADSRGGADMPEGLLLQRAELRLPIADVRGIRRISALRIDGRQLAFGPSSDGSGSLRTIAVPIDVAQWDEGEHAFELELTLAGTGSLHFLPLARRTEASVVAPWPDPSFNGAFLPAEHHVQGDGFEAHWQVLDLNRSYGQHWQEDVRGVDPATAAFGVSLYQPADLYQRNERAGKYGVLFIALTFIAFFLFEVLRKLRVHPVQYLLIGLALTTFYVVLLAFSEQVGFALAYLAAATAVVLLVGGYAAAVLRARRAGALLGVALAFVYALLYGLVVSEQYSLLMGAIALLVVVGVLMYVTRKVDWYTYSAASPSPSV
ncbi:MAG: cell envelope integrity protein CreD [Rudaea sp.]